MNAPFQNQSFFSKTILFCCALAAILTGCKTAELQVDNDLRNETEAYQVKGRQGSQIGQVLTFGDFKTSKVKRGWTFGYSIPFLVKFNGASEKISFTQSDASGRAADVALVSKFRETELTQLETYFSVSLNYKNYCAGSVKMDDSNWEFVVHNVDGPQRSNATAGFIRNGRDRIEVTGIRTLEGAPALLTQNDVYGYEFRLGGKVIGAVATINNGKVWFKNGLNGEMRLLLASVSSGLMLRNSVEEASASLN
ncbi:hypothetical protein [Dyadobacter fermentans]|uniref:Uncharacterized protein n=1 Tax=Dyadobacter fermentans (strain ATCC 700827 / DSM 18053 / CIP 107007 / KCTC 52180 / NS114) TaxID=471854 RepID=C6VRT5_DYAFD|nr:hypothetical protein [Dyadobacter fermentans]ACT92788.1 hypothetical protein Dfer_1543 [Dyadobacter fermentans DSM 18053]